MAVEAELDITGAGPVAKVYTFNGTVPGPEFRARVGDTVIVHFINQLSEPSSIHWHGIEVNNANDGTAVTQAPVRPGESFTYQFQVLTPGIFWYHPHMKPTNQVFKGMYGAFIVSDDPEQKLAELKIIPTATQTVVLSDITICKAPGQNDLVTFPADPNLPWAGGPAFPGHALSPSPRVLCESPIDLDGNPLRIPLEEGRVPNVQPSTMCGRGRGGECRVNEGQLVLVNGRVAADRGGSPSAPDPLSPDAEVIDVQVDQGVRLQLINAAIARYFRLRLTDQNGKLVPLYRIGGDAGLIDQVRLEGGVQDQLDTKYDRGELLLTPAGRSDVVVAVPETSAPGDVLTLWTLDYVHTGFGFSRLPTVPILHLRVVESGETASPESAFVIDESVALLADARVDAPVETLKAVAITDHLLDPSSFAVPLPGSANEEMQFTSTGPGPSIDQIVGHFDASMAELAMIPHIRSSRYAYVGDVLELSIKNATMSHHPFHLHGFSIQPVRFEDSDNLTVLTYDYNEFTDTVDIPAGYRLVFRLRLDDRPMQDGVTAGGALGRWVLHCHIFHHAAQGMITELVVLPRPGDTFSSP